jgi:hypothetical protein
MTWQCEPSGLILVGRRTCPQKYGSTHYPIRLPQVLLFRDEERNAFQDQLLRLC